MSLKWGIIVAIGVFVIGIAAGVALPGEVGGWLSDDLAALKELSALLGPFKISTAIFIYTKNLTTLWVSFILSPILCLVPLLSLALNGFLLSFVAVAVIEQKSLWYLLAGILPHGILELPALIIGEGVAIIFGVVTVGSIFSENMRGLWVKTLKESLKYLIIASALLLPAAFIETYITPLLIR